MTERARGLWRAVALGLATGGRSQAGLAAVALTTPAGGDSRLAGRRTKAALAAAAVGELCVDKFPGTPSRLGAGGLAPRVLLGGLAAAALARRRSRSSTTPAALGAVSALAGAVAGVRLRTLIQRRTGSGLPGALVEDAVVIALAVAAVS